MSSSNINALSTAFQPLIERSLRRLDTATVQTADGIQQRGLQNLKTLTGPSAVDTAADVGTAPPAVSKRLLDIVV
jgi:hypothetical protein